MNETPQDPHTPPPHEPPPQEPHRAVPPPATPVASSQDERVWALAAHLAALSAFVSGGIGAIIGPLVVWLIKREEMPFVNDQGREALNFNITIALAMVALVVFSIITFGLGLVLAIPAMWLLGIYWLVMVIIGAIKAHEGVAYRYPFTLRLVK